MHAQLRSFVPAFAAFIAAATLSACGGTSSGAKPPAGGSSALGAGAALTISPPSVSLAPSATTNFTASGGSGGYRFTIFSGSGSIDPSTGYFMAPGAGGTVYVRVTDSAGAIAHATVSVATSSGGGGGSGTLSLSPAAISLGAGENATFTATGGSGGYTYSIYSGAGTINSSDGIFTAPATVGVTYVRVSDSSGAVAYASATVASLGTLSISPSTITMGVSASTTFSASGGSGSYRYFIYSGGGYINQATGHYTTSSYAGTAYVGVIDSHGATAYATITVSNGASGTRAVYRFYKSSTGEHFYTTSSNEGYDNGYAYEGLSFRVLTASVSGTRALYRCLGNGKHFISTSSSCEGHRNEGAYGYAYTSARTGYVPLHRFVKSSNGDHLNTLDRDEGTRAGLTYEGILGYVLEPF